MYRKWIKRIMSFLLILILIFPSGISNVYATNETILYIKDTKSGSSEAVTTDTDDVEGGWSWVAETATLTLDGFDGEYIEANGDINIILKGSNTITLPATPADNEVNGIKTTAGNININDDGEGERDSLTITQTELTRSDVYVTGIYAYGGVNVTDCDIAINIAGADKAQDYDSYRRNGIIASNDTTYINGSASLDIDIAETRRGACGVVRGLNLDTTGNIDVNIYDAYTEDDNVGKNLSAVDGIKITKSGNVSLSAINDKAVDGPLVIGENSGTVTFKGSIRCGSSENQYIQYKTYVSIASNKKVVVTENAEAKTGIVYKEFDVNDYGCYLLTEAGEKVTDGSIQTVSPNPLTFADCSEIDMGDMVVDSTYTSACFHGLVSGGSGEYSFSIDPNFPLPEGMALQSADYSGTFYAKIKGTPTNVCDAGTIRIIVTDSEEATAYIDMSYGAITNPPKYIDIDGEKVITTEDGTGTNWVYEGATKTLTLNGYNAGTIESEDTLNIILKGNNTITMPATPVDDVYGILGAGDINIVGDDEEGEDSLTIIQTGFTIRDVYVTGIDARKNINITDCKIIINIAGADTEKDYDSYGRYGMVPHAGSTYVYGTGSIDIDIAETTRGANGVVRGLNLDTTGNIDVNIYDAYTEDGNVGSSLEGVGGLKVTKSGTINISVPNGDAISGPLQIEENAGTIKFKGSILCGSSEHTYLYYPGNVSIAPNKKIIITDNEEAKSGIVYKEFSVRDYGCYLLNEAGEKVTDGSIQTVSPNVLSFADSNVLDLGDMKIGTEYGTGYFHALVSGGSGGYTFSIDAEHPLPDGMELVLDTRNNNTAAKIIGTPTTESEPGTIRVVVTDSEDSTAYIDIAYGTISVANPITSVTLNKETTSLIVGEEEVLTYTIAPVDASITTVTWSSNDEDIAYVNSTGKITTNKVGKAVITVTTTQGKFTDTCEVVVKEKTPTAVVYGDYIDSLEANANYTINGSSYLSDEYGRISIDDEWRETTVSIIKLNADEDCNSNAQQLYIPSKLAIDISTLSSVTTIEYVQTSYDGTEKEPTVSIEGLEYGTDYTVAYNNNISVGTGRVVITGKGDYFGAIEKYFTISPIDMTGIVVNNYVGTYDKMGHTFSISGVPQGANIVYSLSEEGEYSSVKPAQSDVGILKVYFKITAPNYNTYTSSATIEITPILINEEDIEVAQASFVYDGKEKEPDVSIGDLVIGTDYEVKYENNINAGTASITIKGKGYYGGTFVKTFNISPKKINPILVLDRTSFEYNGKKQQPIVTVKDGEVVLANADYTISYPNEMINVGSYKITVTLKGNYSGTASTEFKIVAAPDKKEPEKDNPLEEIIQIKPILTLSKTKYVYNGKVQKPKVTVRNENTILPSSDYTVTYSKGCKNVGSYKVTVTLKGKYTGTATAEYVINPKATSLKKLTAGKKKLTVTWKKLTSQTTGYEIQYSTSSKLKNARKVTVTKNKTTKTVIKKLKSKKKYYVRIRTYKTVKVNGKNTKFYSSWTKAKKIKIK